MVIELSQVLKLLGVVKSHQNNGKSKRQQVKKDFELRKIDRGLEYPVYEENEKFCLQTKIPRRVHVVQLPKQHAHIALFHHFVERTDPPHE